MEDINRIKVLDADTQRKIAAGEVIVCATGVIKELVENSIDAQCTTIEITLDSSKIIVSDNGSGILKEDLEILCNRFTTSKITKYEDLLSIGSFGFRGEALSAISCVSKLLVQTRHKSQSIGYTCSYSDYVLTSNSPKAMNTGTTISASDLFYNLLNRQAGLRSFQSEINACLRMVQSYSIEYPDIKFILRKGLNRSKAPIYNSISNSRFQRIQSISKIDNFIALYKSEDSHFEDEQVDLLIVPKLESNELLKSVMFIASHPHVSINGAQPPFILFINNRLVHSSVFKKLILGYFETYLPKGKYPFCYLSLNLKSQIIDVNVHPSKKEVVISCEDKIVELLNEILENKIKTVDQSRPFQVKVLDSATTLSQSVLAPIEQETNNVLRKRDFKDLLDKYSNKKQKIIPPNQLRRTTSRDVKLTSFFSLNNSISSSTRNKQFKLPNSDKLTVEPSVFSSQKPDVSVLYNTVKSPSSPLASDIAMDVGASADEQTADCKNNVPSSISYTSNVHITAILKDHVFVGLVEKSFVLLQHQCDLIMIPAKSLCLDILYSALLTCSMDCGKLIVNKYVDIGSEIELDLKRIGFQFDNNNLTSIPLISKYMRPKQNIEELMSELNKLDSVYELAAVMARKYLNIVDTGNMGTAAEDLLMVCKMSKSFKFVSSNLKMEEVQILANLKELYQIFERC
eukprot:NODE_95_length_21460_cov_0.300220.p1 type:complete len:685 gc:universal NODE_95_length_21460_cov_0.300220:4054-2000(-)